MSRAGSAWKAQLDRASGAFTSPSFTLFCELMCAWVLATGRRTICGMVAVMDPASRSAHDAYHRLVRAGAWSMDGLWAATVSKVVERLGPDGPIICLLDDSLFHRTGPNVDGAGSFRDAVRSTRNRVVYAWGLNLVVLTVRVVPPWGGMPIAVPIGVRLHRKGGTKLPALAAELITELAARLPERHFIVCADGAYACLAGDALPRTTVVSRMRRDAALFGPPRPARANGAVPAPEENGFRSRPSSPPAPAAGNESSWNGGAERSPSWCGPARCCGIGFAPSRWSGSWWSATRPDTSPTTSSSPPTST
jgi:DDE superfamily endonuclease